MGHALLRLVAESVVDATFVLDGIVHRDTDPPDEPGEPVAIVLARPETPWFDAAVGALLDTWADRSESVRFSVRKGRRGSVAVLQGPAGTTTVRLDLLDVA